MSAHSTKATHAAIKAYHAALKEFADFCADHEGATETAFGRLLADTGRAFGWTLIPKQSMKVDGKNIIPDGSRSGIVSDPNREDDPQYIVRLAGQVVRVSVETVKIVKGLPADYS